MSKNETHSEDIKAIIKSLKSFCRLGLSDSTCIDLALDSVGIEDSIMQADAGDRDAKKRMRHLAGCYLSDDKFGPIPRALRQFAAKELDKLSEDTPSKCGSPPRNYRSNLRIAHWIYREMKGGKTLEEASFDLCECIAEGIRTYTTFRGYRKTPDFKTLQGIYNKMLPEIKRLYEEVRKIKATVIPIRRVD